MIFGISNQKSRIFDKNVKIICKSIEDKFEIINSMLKDIRKDLDLEEQRITLQSSGSQNTHQYNLFKKAS